MSFHAAHRSYWVYILASKPHGTLYIGVTNSLERRAWQHKTEAMDGFTKQYGVKSLVYFEEFRDVTDAMVREKQLKGWLRAKKIALIQKENSLWKDLAADWFDEPVISKASP